MTDKEILETIFDMRYHYSEYMKRKELLQFLEVKYDNFDLTEKEETMVMDYYVNKKNLKGISEESGLSYGYVRHRIIAVRKKIMEQINEGREG